MSRTDKDAPYWVSAEWWEPNHWGCEYDVPHGVRLVRIARSLRRGARRACDLPDRPVCHRPGFSAWRHGPRCIWEPEYRGYPFSHVPQWYVHHVWTNAERRSVRDDCRRALAERRAGGEVETEPSVRQHRHGAKWYWE